MKNVQKMVALMLSVMMTAALFSCSDDEEVMNQPLPTQPEQLTDLLEQYNANIAAFQTLTSGEAEIVDYVAQADGHYKLMLTNQQVADVYARAEESSEIPLLGIDKEGFWNVQLNGVTQVLTDRNGKAVAALAKTGQGTFTPQVALGKEGCWQVSFNGYQWHRLSDRPAPSLEGETAADFALYQSVVLNEQAQTLTLQPRVAEGTLVLETNNSGAAQAWKNFLMSTEKNVLLDYSYAGYDHGETAPKDGFAWGYRVFNVKERMEKEQISALEAFTRILDENKLIRKSNKSATNDNARIVVYFPAGEYILHSGKGKQFPYDIIGGNFIIKGDGANRTRLVMESPNGDTEKTNIPLLTVKHTNSPSNDKNSPLLAQVTENAPKGSFSLTVSSTDKLKRGQWVQLRLRSGSKDLLAKELGPITPGATWSISQAPLPITENSADKLGIKVTEFHQIKHVNGNQVVFYEPLMHEVDVQYNDCLGWEIREYKHYENVGIEGLTFVGKAITPYYHHGEGMDPSIAWKYDQEYRPLALIRMVNSWVRDVNFESVSEAVTFSESANCSAYRIEITGHRGHGAVRAAGSSRIFIGAVSDNSRDGKPNKFGVVGEGQWHGCGVSKPSIGNVVWHSTWGKNASFESHATQPRATLFDCCSGGLMKYHAGGAEDEAPNHLSDLTFWNWNVTGTTDEQHRDFSTNFNWWSNGDKWWKIYPPIVVGTHGLPVTFSQEESQLTYEESTGVKVSPESLYEAQLKKRLGRVPAWLNALKK